MKIELLNHCRICPQECMARRNEEKIGKCGCNDKIKVALVSLHYYEEPCISGTQGSGTIFTLIAICIVNFVKIMKLVSWEKKKR